LPEFLVPILTALHTHSVQERFTAEVADALMDTLAPLGVAVVVEAACVGS
jgi:GTP cyclohydrolase I